MDVDDEPSSEIDMNMIESDDDTSGGAAMTDMNGCTSAAAETSAAWAQMLAGMSMLGVLGLNGRVACCTMGVSRVVIALCCAHHVCCATSCALFGGDEVSGGAVMDMIGCSSSSRSSSARGEGCSCRDICCVGKDGGGYAYVAS
jgi:hypothetical protein